MARFCGALILVLAAFALAACSQTQDSIGKVKALLGRGEAEEFSFSTATSVALTNGAALNTLRMDIRGFNCDDALVSVTIADRSGHAVFNLDKYYTEYGFPAEEDQEKCEADLNRFVYEYPSRLETIDTGALQPYPISAGRFTPTATRDEYDRARASVAPLLCIPTSQRAGFCLWNDVAQNRIVELATYAD